MTSAARPRYRDAAQMRYLRMPGAVGVVLAAISIPLILLFPQIRLVVVLVALCLYPLLDLPRTLARSSWWLGALLSAVGWCILFLTLTGVAESVQRIGEDAMVLLFPFMLYPAALVLAGVVRLESRWRGRPRESQPRVGTMVLAGALALGILVPLTLGLIPVLTEKITGNTPANTEYSADGNVVSAAADTVTVRVSARAPEAFHFGADTRFDFRGPGSALVRQRERAGPEWLKEGQRVGLDYVYRGGIAQASAVNIWLDRKGCADNETWKTAAESPRSASGPSLDGTIWEGGGDSFEFQAAHRLANTNAFNQRSDGQWRQNGAAVLLEVNDCYALYEGRIEGDAITGEYSNVEGGRESWTVRRKMAR